MASPSTQRVVGPTRRVDVGPIISFNTKGCWSNNLLQHNIVLQKHKRTGLHQYSAQVSLNAMQQHAKCTMLQQHARCTNLLPPTTT